MAKLITLYNQPKDAEAFDAYYYGKHVPIAKNIPGLRRFEVSTGPVATPQGISRFYLVAQLEFDSLAAIGKGLSSPEGIAAGSDLANFAGAGVELLVCETREL